MSRHLLRFDRRDVQITLQADGARIALAQGICREPPSAWTSEFERSNPGVVRVKRGIEL